MSIDHRKSASFFISCAEPLECDKCGTQIGYVRISDLEGSYFFCKECKLADFESSMPKKEPI